MSRVVTISILLVITASQTMAQSDDSKRVMDSISLKATAGDLRGLIDILPTLELLWKQNPSAYLEAIKLNVHVLIASSDPEAKQAALNTFSKVLEKASPNDDTVAATAYFRFKLNIVDDYFNLEEVRTNKERLLMIAKFVGEVRSRRIPNYQNRWTNLPAREILDAAGVNEVADLPTQEQKEAVAVAIDRNKEDVKMNGLQGILSSADSGLTSMIMEYAKGFSGKKPENQEFYKELVIRAKLTDEEKKKLYTPK